MNQTIHLSWCFALAVSYGAGQMKPRSMEFICSSIELKSFDWKFQSGTKPKSIDFGRLSDDLTEF